MLLLGLYYGLLAWTTRDLSHPFDQFLLYKQWMIPLVLGFGLQMGLFGYVRRLHRRHGLGARATASSGGGASAVAMVACCAHHLTDVLPVLGVSAAASFLTSYQTEFLALGVASNVLGVLVMLRLARGKPPYPAIVSPFIGRRKRQEKVCHEEV